MRQRAVRIRVSGTTVRLGQTAGELVNLSLGGALMRLRANVAIGTVSQLLLANGSDEIELAARVLRNALVATPC